MPQNPSSGSPTRGRIVIHGIIGPEENYEVQFDLEGRLVLPDAAVREAIRERLDRGEDLRLDAVCHPRLDKPCGQ